MKRHEVITKYREAITAAMIECYRAVVESDGRIMSHLYIWEDGEVETLEAPQGDAGWLKARDAEPRKLFPVTDIEEPAGFSIWDYSEHGEPEDPADRETLRAEIIDYLMESYTDTVPDRLGYIIQEAEEEAAYDDGYYF